MAIETRCSTCQTILTIDDQHAGRRARCPNCATEYEVPSQSDEAALDSVCHYCGAVVPQDASVDDRFKTCDDCRASIDENQEAMQEELRRQEQGRHLLITGVLFLGAVGIVILVMELLRRYVEIP